MRTCIKRTLTPFLTPFPSTKRIQVEKINMLSVVHYHPFTKLSVLQLKAIERIFISILTLFPWIHYAFHRYIEGYIQAEKSFLCHESGEIFLYKVQRIKLRYSHHYDRTQIRN